MGAIQQPIFEFSTMIVTHSRQHRSSFGKRELLLRRLLQGGQYRSLRFCGESVLSYPHFPDGILLPGGNTHQHASNHAWMRQQAYSPILGSRLHPTHRCHSWRASHAQGMIQPVAFYYRHKERLSFTMLGIIPDQQDWNAYPPAGAALEAA